MYPDHGQISHYFAGSLASSVLLFCYFFGVKPTTSSRIKLRINLCYLVLFSSPLALFIINASQISIHDAGWSI